MRRKALMPSPPLLLPLAAEAVTRPRQRPQPRKRNRTTADFTGAKGPRLEARLRRLDLVELVPLASLEAAEEAFHGATSRILEQPSGLGRRQRGDLSVCRGHGTKQPLPCLEQHRAKLTRSVLVDAEFPVGCHGRPSRGKCRRLEEEGPRPRSRSPDPSETAENPRLLLGLDRNRRALGGRSLGQGDRQQPILEGGADLAAVHRHRQADGAGKGPVGPLHAVVTLLLLLLLHLLLTLDGQELLLERDLNVLGLHA